MFWWLSFLLVVISIGACIYYEIQTSSKKKEDKAENIRIIDELSKQKEVAKQNIFRSLEKEREKSGLKPGEAQIILDKSKNNEEIVGESIKNELNEKWKKEFDNEDN